MREEIAMKKWSELSDQECGYRVLKIIAALALLALLNAFHTPSPSTSAKHLSFRDTAVLGMVEQEMRRR